MISPVDFKGLTPSTASLIRYLKIRMFYETVSYSHIGLYLSFVHILAVTARLTYVGNIGVVSTFTSNQRSTMNRFFDAHKHSWNFEYKWLNNYSDPFVLTTTLICKYRLQWVCVKRWHYTHTIKYIWFTGLFI